MSAKRSGKIACSICGGKRAALSFQGGVCAPCGKHFGLLGDSEKEAMPRPRGPCARCGHAELVVCAARQRASPRRLAPLAASYLRRLAIPILTGEEEVEYANEPDPSAPVGVFVACVCRACGFTDWYALRPETIPIGPAYGTYIVVIGQPSPYR